MNVQDVQLLLRDRPKSKAALDVLIDLCITNKVTSFSVADHTEAVQELEKVADTVKLYDHRFQLDFNSLIVNEVLRGKAEAIMGLPMPNTIANALAFINSFCEEIRKPEVRTYWYGHLESGLESYGLIYLNHIHNVDVTGFLKTITTEMEVNSPELRVFKNDYTGAFPHLKDDIKKRFDIVDYLYSNKDTSYFAADCLEKVGEHNKEKAVELYNYGKDHGAIKHERFLPILLIHLYPVDKPKYFLEVTDLHKVNALQGLIALSFFKYDTSEEIEHAFHFISRNRASDNNYLQQLPHFLCRLIENTKTPDDVRRSCFAEIKQLLKIGDEQLKGNLLMRFQLITGFEKEKMELLPDFLTLGSGVFTNYFNHFESPTPLFDLIRDAFLRHGLRTKFDVFSQGISMVFSQSPEKCEHELLRMLTDDLAILRYAGVQILTNNHGHLYPIDVLKLDAEGQKRIIETLLPQPHGIEKILPFVLKLKATPHDNVFEILTRELKNLIRAYDHDLVDMVKPCLDLSSPRDQKLQSDLEEVLAQYLKEKDLKNSISEFDPAQNQASMMQLYFRLENEKQAEMIERTRGNSFFTQMGKTINVIRGNAFKTENNPTITKMSTVSTSMLVDQRYYIDPDYYEWTFQLNTYGQNYNSEVNTREE